MTRNFRGIAFEQRLESLLEDDYLCWFNVSLGRRYQHPYFDIWSYTVGTSRVTRRSPKK